MHFHEHQNDTEYKKRPMPRGDRKTTSSPARTAKGHLPLHMHHSMTVLELLPSSECDDDLMDPEFLRQRV